MLQEVCFSVTIKCITWTSDIVALTHKLKLKITEPKVGNKGNQKNGRS